MMRSLTRLLLALSVSVPASGVALARSGPLLLTDHQLDTINAGYMQLQIDASANARFGNPRALTITVTNIDVEESARDDGFIYTVTEGHGYAYARGEKVLTSLDLFLDTDEEFVSYNVGQVNNHSGRDYQMLLPTRDGSFGMPANEQLKFMTVQVVTRQRAGAERQP